MKIGNVSEGPIVLGTKCIRGGNRKLVFSQCQEYLVLDRQGDKITRIKTFEERDFLKAKEDYAKSPCAR